MRCTSLGWVLAALYLSGELVGARAAAAQDPFELRYQAPGPTCPGRTAFRELVAARMGADPFAEEAPRTIEAMIERHSAGGFVATVRARGPDGEVLGVRELSNPEPTCEAMARALALAVSVSLDPLGAGRPPAPAPPRERVEERPPAEIPPSPEPIRETPSDPPAESSGPDSDPDPIEIPMMAGLGTTYALGPAFALGPRVGLGVGWKGLTLALLGRADWMPTDWRNEEGIDVSASAYSLGLSACGHLLLAQGCVGVHFGALSAISSAVSDPGLRTAFIAYGEVAVGLRLPLWERRLFLRAMLELRVPLVRVTLIVDGSAQWRAEPVHGGLSIGLAYRFGGDADSSDGNGSEATR